jgi:hypothetical protein
VANDIGAALCNYALAQSSVAALVADRAWPDVLKQNAAMPAFTYTVVSDVPEHHLTGMSGISQARVQFDFYADTRKESNDLAEAVRIAIDADRGTLGGEQVRTCHLENTFRFPEQPVNGSGNWRYVTTCDYLVWYVQSTS